MSEKMRKELGERVRFLRRQQGIPQSVFASMVGMDRGYLIGIEKGLRNPSLDKLESIANGLGVSVSYLLRGVCEDVQEQPPEASRSSYEYFHLDRRMKL